MAGDERTTMEEENKIDVRHITIDAAHAATTKVAPSILQCRQNIGYVMSATF